jgi:hypothetical protein
VTLTLPVAAHDAGSGTSPFICQWFQKLMQPDNADMSCYGEADALEADSFEIRRRPVRRHHHERQGHHPRGREFRTQNKVKWDNSNPTGHGIIFIGNAGQIYCYVTPGGTASW